MDCLFTLLQRRALDECFIVHLTFTLFRMDCVERAEHLKNEIRKDLFKRQIILKDNRHLSYLSAYV